MNPLYKPPEDCTNGEICIEDAVERLRSSDRSEWVRWAVGLMLGILAAGTGWLFGRVNGHGELLVKHDAQITNLERTDAEMKQRERDKISQDEQRWQRLEEKLDRILERHGR